jgi:hypothetical protein
MTNTWLRLWHDMPTDPKFRVIARKSGRPISEVLSVFVLMLTNASSNDVERGALLNWSDEDAAAALDLDPAHVTAIHAAMQGKTLDSDKLSGWAKRQPKREDNSADRVKAFRERSKQPVTQCNADVTHGNSRLEETRGEKIPKTRDARENGGEDVDAAWQRAYAESERIKGGKTAKSQRAEQRTTGELDGSKGITLTEGKLTLAEGPTAIIAKEFPFIDVASVCNKAAPELMRHRYPTSGDAMAVLRKWAQIASEQRPKSPSPYGSVINLAAVTADMKRNMQPAPGSARMPEVSRA